MTRISRISTPRATLAVFALLVVVMTGFGLLVDGAETVAAETVRVAKEAVGPASVETSQHCWTPTRVPLVALDRRSGRNDVEL